VIAVDYNLFSFSPIFAVRVPSHDEQGRILDTLLAEEDEIQDWVASTMQSTTIVTPPPLPHPPDRPSETRTDPGQKGYIKIGWILPRSIFLTYQTQQLSTSNEVFRMYV